MRIVQMQASDRDSGEAAKTAKGGGRERRDRTGWVNGRHKVGRERKERKEA